jgi:hypothetical protein
MRDDQDVVWLAVFALPARARPEAIPMELISDFAYQGIEARLDVCGHFAVCAAIAPDVPVGGVAVLFALGADLRRRFALVGPVVPLAHGGRDLDRRRGAHVEGVAGRRGGVGPGVARFAAEVEELEGALGAGAGGDVAVCVRGWCFSCC